MVDNAIIIDVGDRITLRIGDSLITMLKNGDITISGRNVDNKSSGDVLNKGSKIAAK